MLETLKPAAIMTAGASIDAELTQDIPVISQQELHTEAPAAAPWKQRKDTDLLYVIFTSGSTGEPKGVSICHRSVIDMVEQFMRAFDFADGAVWGNQAPFDFDVSVKDIFLSLRVGGRLEILEKKLFSFPKLLLERLNERSVDTIIWAVPALKILARLHAFQTLRPLYLKNIMFSGEVMPPKTLQYWMQAVPQARFVNLYGPTEITCNGRGAAGGPDRQAVCQLRCIPARQRRACPGGRADRRDLRDGKLPVAGLLQSSAALCPSLCAESAEFPVP